MELATDDAGAWRCLLPLSVAALARGAYAEVVEHCLAAAALDRRPAESLGIAALAAAYAGDLDRARALNEPALARAASPSMRSWTAYVAGEIDSRARRTEPAEQAYLRAIELARASGATFLVAVATVGLLTVRAAAGRVREALVGYREVVDYFARTGNCTHLWVTLRNLAALLRRLGDTEPADLLDAAADAAPDAPADDRSRRDPLRPLVSAAPPGDRGAVLQVARRAIEGNVTRS